jgi:hypothetical protein
MDCPLLGEPAALWTRGEVALHPSGVRGGLDSLRPGHMCPIRHEPISYETDAVSHGIGSCWISHGGATGSRKKRPEGVLYGLEPSLPGQRRVRQQGTA